jgi:xanthine dehydrogenase molybdopterin-binding subunit B
MGQGLHTKILAIACRELGLSPGQRRVMVTRTDQVPNTSATAASSSTDLNGAAVAMPAKFCWPDWRKSPPRCSRKKWARAFAPADVVFANDEASAGECSVPFGSVTMRAWLNRVSLAATGFYATPEIGWDREIGMGPSHFTISRAAQPYPRSRSMVSPE